MESHGELRKNDATGQVLMEAFRKTVLASEHHDEVECLLRFFSVSSTSESFDLGNNSSLQTLSRIGVKVEFCRSEESQDATGQVTTQQIRLNDHRAADAYVVLSIETGQITRLVAGIDEIGTQSFDRDFEQALLGWSLCEVRLRSRQRGR